MINGGSRKQLGSRQRHKPRTPTATAPRRASSVGAGGPMMPSRYLNRTNVLNSGREVASASYAGPTARRVLTPRVTAKSGLRSNPRAAPPRGIVIGIDGETYGPLSQRKGAKSRSALYDLRRIDYSPRRCAEGTTPHNMGYGPARPPHTRATRHLHAAGERVVR